MECSIHSLIVCVAPICGDHVLLVRYKDMPDDQSGWFLPDDDLHHLEHPDNAAVRILSEDSGLQASRVQLSHIESFQGRNKTWHLMFDYRADIEDRSAFRAGGRVAEANWFPLAELPPRSAVAHHGWALEVLETMLGGA